LVLWLLLPTDFVVRNFFYSQAKFNIMENNNMTEQPKSKKMNDFIKLLVGTLLFIAALVALKYLMASFGVI